MPKFQIHRDPRLFAPVDRPPGPYKLAVGLDLGTTTGVAFAWFRPGQPFVVGALPIIIGQWDLSAGQYDSGAIRFVRLRRFLAELDPDLITYEQVRNTPPAGDFKASKFNINAIAARITQSAQLFGGLMATVCCWAEQYGVPAEGIPIGAIKKRATGHGGAGKEAVIAACNAEFGFDLDPIGYETSGCDNVADAVFCLLLGLEAYATGIPAIRDVPEQGDRP